MSASAHKLAIDQSVVFDRALIDKYHQAGPRYTSYPTAPHFHEGFGPEQFRQMAERSNRQRPHGPLSLYLHIPFCRSACRYCGCTRTVTTNEHMADIYLQDLYREIEQMGQIFAEGRPVVQLHLGGGTPTYLNPEQLTGLMAKLRGHFQLAEGDGGEYGIEVDPRSLQQETLATLRRIGFNRVSFGVQDLNPVVQKAVNRVQPKEMNLRVVQEARSLGFRSINIDLMYGLPHQNERTFDESLTWAIRELNPDRLALFNYAHLPQYFPHQAKMDEAALPTVETRLRILENAIHTLIEAGYLYIGMDHFAKPDDELAVAQRNGVLHRNFQGYTTHGECDLVAIGASAISQVGLSYAQNLRDIDPYAERIRAGELAIFRGYALSRDDEIRREIIMRMMCDFQLDPAKVAARFGIDFEAMFGDALTRLREQVQEGLLEESHGLFRVTPAGRLLIRNISMAFDWYLKNAQSRKTFSKTI